MNIIFKNLLSYSLINSVRQQNLRLIELITTIKLIFFNIALILSLWKCQVMHYYFLLILVACLFCISSISLILIRKRYRALFGYVAVYGSLILLSVSEFNSLRYGTYSEQKLLFSGIVIFLSVFLAGMIINPKHILYLGIYSILRILFCAFLLKTNFIIDILPYYLLLQVGGVVIFFFILRTIYIFSYQSMVNNKLINSENENLNQLMNLKQDMISMILHDIRNPLNAILSVSREKKLPDQVHISVNRILDLADDFIDVHRMEENKFLIHPDYKYIKQTMRGAIEQVNYLLHEKNNWIRLYELNSLQLNVDHRLIERVFVNVLTNSIKHSLPNSPIILRCEFLSDMIRFEISNNGESISPDVVNTLFEKYVSNDEALITDSGSKGLGLHFCKMVVEAHGGNIGFDTNLYKKGACTWFTLPYKNEALSEVVVMKDILSPLKLDQEDKGIIFPYMVRINQNKIFEISRIMLILNELTAPAYPNVELWKKELLNAVLIGNNEHYTELLAMVG